MKILLVDDDEDDREFFADALVGVNMNTQLQQLDNGKSCLDYLMEQIENLPNLIFLDLNMPIMNGFECLAEIRKIPKFKELPIAIYSTSSSDKDIEQTFLSGANVYIKKPSSFEDLKKSLAQVIKMNWAYNMDDFKKENFLLRI